MDSGSTLPVHSVIGSSGDHATESVVPEKELPPPSVGLPAVSESFSTNAGLSTKKKPSGSVNSMHDDVFFLTMLSLASADKRLPQFEPIAAPEPGPGVVDWVLQQVLRWTEVLSSDDIIPILVDLVNKFREDAELVKESEDAELVKESEVAKLVEEKEVAEQAKEMEVAEQAKEMEVAEKAEENKVAEESKEGKVLADADEKVPSPDSSVARKKPLI